MTSEERAANGDRAARSEMFTMKSAPTSGAFAAQRRRPVTAGTMPTDTPLFTVLLAGTVVVVAGLTFVPALALGPIAEALS